MLRKKLKMKESPAPVPEDQFWQKLFKIECDLYSELLQLNFPASICAIYNPLEYAAEVHCQYMQKFLDGPKDLLFVGMNPGPWGCCQTGVHRILARRSLKKKLIFLCFSGSIRISSHRS
jgi:hypothetical protein